MPPFFLTKRAIIDLLEIENYSLREWGEDQTHIYMDDLYKAFNEISKKLEMGRLRSDRSFPFYMARARLHFAIYKPLDDVIIIASILHGSRNIESIVTNMAVTLAAEIKEIEDKSRL